MDLLMFLSVRRSNVFNIQHSSNRLNLYPLFGKDKNLSLARELTHAMGEAKKKVLLSQKKLEQLSTQFRGEPKRLRGRGVSAA